MYKYAYAIIRKSDGYCTQTIRTNLSGWVLDNQNEFSVVIPSENSGEYNDKYYHDNKWWERVYNRYETIVEKDEQGNIIAEYTRPVEEYGYTETEMVV